MAKKKTAKRAKEVRAKRGRPRMKTFSVSVEVTHEHEIVVSASSEAEAKRKAIQIVESGDNYPTSKHIRTERCWDQG
jgi:hypothetical protein